MRAVLNQDTKFNWNDGRQDIIKAGTSVKVGAFRAGDSRVQVYKFGKASASVSIDDLTIVEN